MNAIYKIISREPVLLGKAIAATINLIVLAQSWSEPIKGGITTVVLLWIGFGERLLSSPTSTVDEQVQGGYNAAVADISSLKKK